MKLNGKDYVCQLGCEGVWTSKAEMIAHLKGHPEDELQPWGVNFALLDRVDQELFQNEIDE